jgi:hypothetical protein
VCVSECIIVYVDTERAYNIAVFNRAMSRNVIFNALLQDALLYLDVHLTNKKKLTSTLKIPIDSDPSRTAILPSACVIFTWKLFVR